MNEFIKSAVMCFICIDIHGEVPLHSTAAFVKHPIILKVWKKSCVDISETMPRPFFCLDVAEF